MLASQFRLKGPDSYDRVQEEGEVFQSSSFGISSVDRKDGGPSRFGFIVSTKISKLAVQRNRIKRALSEAVRFFYPDIKEGHDIVFLAKISSTRVSTDDLMREVKESLKKAGLTK